MGKEQEKWFGRYSIQGDLCVDCPVVYVQTTVNSQRTAFAHYFNV